MVRNTTEPRLSRQGILVLKAFIEKPAKELCGADIMKMAGLSSGTLYPILMRFEKMGLVSSEWENRDPKDLGRPRRRLYRVLGKGQTIAHQVLKQFTLPFNELTPGRI